MLQQRLAKPRVVQVLASMFATFSHALHRAQGYNRLTHALTKASHVLDGMTGAPPAYQ